MIRLLDIPAALRARGWPPDLNTTAVFDVTDVGPQRLALHLRAGRAEVDDTDAPPEVTLTTRHLAAWYAGAYRSAASARMAGIEASCETALRDFVRATSDLEPWMPDHF